MNESRITLSNGNKLNASSIKTIRNLFKISIDGLLFKRNK